MAEKQIVSQNQLGVPIANKTILGQLTSFSDGTAKWTYAKDTNVLIAGGGDRSTFTLSKQQDGTWSWSPTTNTSVQNLATREGLTTTQITDSLYKTTTTQSVLNAGNVTNLGGISAAQKLGVPGTRGSATVTGPLPGQVSGNFDGQSGATNGTGTNTESGVAGVKEGISSFNQSGLQIKDGGVRQSYTGGKGPGGAYMYPIKMDPTQDKIKFTMYRYEPKKVSVSNIASGTGFSGSNKGSSMGIVILPIQPQISDSNSVSWGENSMNAIDAMAAAAALGAIQKGGEALADAAQGVQDLIKENKGDLESSLAAYFAGQATGSNPGFFTRATGAILNPNLELLFTGPSLRSFTFNFSMSAREKGEAEEIRNIIRFFKQGMSVKRAQSNLFLKTPNVFDISYCYAGGDNHPWMNKIKTCALQNCIVNYTPAGNYATYDNGAMTQYDMTLTFGEIDPLYDDDYDQLGNNHIGY